VSFEEFLVWVHVSAVVAGLGALFATPLLIALARGSEPAQAAALHRAQRAITTRLGNPGLLVVFLAGAVLASIEDVWPELWVTIPVIIVVLLGGIGGAFLAPRERRLVELAEAGGGPEYRRVLGQVATASYVSLALVLVAAFFMVTRVG
jgi:hypothetical protein